MNKRQVWVVEENFHTGEYQIWSLHRTREEARQSAMDDGFHGAFRVVKYVPAVETKRSHKKAGGK